MRTRRQSPLAAPQPRTSILSPRRHRRV